MNFRRISLLIVGLLAISVAQAQDIAPPVSLGGSAGITGGQSLGGQNILTHMTDANYTMIAAGWWAATQVVPSSLTLSATRTITLPLNKGQQYTFCNYSTGGFAVTVGGSTGATVSIPNSSCVPIDCTDGANYVQVNGSGGDVSSVSNSDGSLTVTPTTGAVVASINTAHANTYTATQTFPNASIPNATLANSLATVNGVSCVLGGTCSLPFTCGGSGGFCPYLQVNPTTSGGVATTTSSITTSDTSIPVSTCSGFTFPGGSILAFNNDSSTEYMIGVSCIGTTMTVSQRGFYNPGSVTTTLPATAWSAGTNVIQVTQATALSTTSAPTSFSLANGTISVGPGSSVASNTYVISAPLQVLSATGNIINNSTLQGGSTSNIYSPTASFYNSVSGNLCLGNGALYSANNIPWFAGAMSQYCSTATNGVPANVFAWVPGTADTNPTNASTPSMWLTPTGQLTVTASVIAPTVDVTTGIEVAGSFGTSGYVLTSTGSGSEWAASGSGSAPCATTSGAMQYNNAGSFGCAPETYNGSLFTASAPYVNSTAGAASAPALQLTGTPYAGTDANSFGQLDMQWGTASSLTTLNANGEAFTIRAPVGYTGNLCHFFTGTTAVFTCGAGGSFTASQEVFAAYFLTTTTAGSFISPTEGTAINETAAVYQFGGSSGVDLRIGVGGTASSTLTANDNYANLVVGSSPVTTPATGTNAILANEAIATIGTVTSGGATLPLAANLFVDAPPTGATLNVSAYIKGPIATQAIDQNAASNTGGSCTMSASTTCAITLSTTYTTPVCVATLQGTSATADATGHSCSVSGATVTITAGTANSSKWGAFVFGNPN